MARYAALLDDVKLRLKVVNDLLGRSDILLPSSTAIESAALQLRMVLESVVFGSLIANQTTYAAVHADFAKDWHAGRLLKKLAAIHPHFYPKPQVIAASWRPGIKAEISPRSAGTYLAEDEFAAQYHRLGALVHAPNPYGIRRDYDAILAELHALRRRVDMLLHLHTIALVDRPGFLFLVALSEDNTGEVRVIPLDKIAELPDNLR
jgi:hypothetical protein